MLSYREALELLLAHVPALEPERCPLEDAAGRILRQPVVADRDFPVFDRVMMDGHALRHADWLAGVRRFRVTGSAPAGKPMTSLAAGARTCVEVMTGAPCPAGADCIIPVEELTDREGEDVTFGEAAEPVPGRFIHRAGSDALAGDVLLESGLRLGSREIGVAASCGAGLLEVSRVPKISVIATGDELVAVDETPALHQIRQSNGYSMATALGRAGYPVRSNAVLNDDTSAALPILRELLSTHEWLVLTGAVSMGPRDFVPSLLVELGCRELFHHIAQRPGKPAGCWIGPAGQIVLALPGNPVSALASLHALVIPALDAASGLKPAPQRLVVIDDRSLQLPRFTRHLPVKFRADGRVEPVAVGNSGDFIGLLTSDGFITLPPQGEGANAAFPFTPWL